MSIKQAHQLRKELKQAQQQIDGLETRIAYLKGMELERSTEALFMTDALFKLVDHILNNHPTAGEISREWEAFKQALEDHGTLQAALNALNVELEIKRADCTNTVMTAWQSSLTQQLN